MTMRGHSRWPALFGQVGLRLIEMDAREVGFSVSCRIDELVNRWSYRKSSFSMELGISAKLLRNKASGFLADTLTQR
jgi:hypothetical protein